MKRIANIKPFKIHGYNFICHVLTQESNGYYYYFGVGKNTNTREEAVAFALKYDPIQINFLPEGARMA